MNLWPHQLDAHRFVAERRTALLHHDMGTGKTLTTLALMGQGVTPVTSDRGGVGSTDAANRGTGRHFKALIIAPLAVVSVWPREVEKHGLSFRCVALDRGSIAKRLEAARAAQAKSMADGRPLLIVVNHDAVWRPPMGDAFLKPIWDWIVVDESHRAKSPGGKLSRWLARASHRSAARLMLSGTPLPHSPLDAYAQFRFLDPTIFGTNFASFRSRYAVMGGYQVNGRAVQVTGYQRMDEFRQRWESIVHRVRKADVLRDLPPVTFEDMKVDISDKAATVYTQMEDELVAEVEAGIVTAANAAVKLVRLQQITSGFVKTEDGIEQALDDAKQSALVEFLGDLPPDEPVAVFCRFTHDLNAVHTAAKAVGRPSVELSGRRNEVGSKWAPAAGAVAAIQIQSGGVGIDLTASAYAVYYSATTNGGDYLQSLARLDRPGQTRPVTIIRMIARGTVDGKIYAAHQRRATLHGQILGDVAHEVVRHLKSGCSTSKGRRHEHSGV